MNKVSEKKKKFILEKIGEPDTYRTRFVAFLDLLGFKTITTQMECAEIKAFFNDIELIKYSFDESLGAITFGADLVDDVDFTIMSDSIVISAEDSYNGLAYLLFICATIQSRLFLSRSKMILLRGGISRGEYFRLNNLLYGPALTNAYLLEDEHACAPRIILAPDIAEELKSNGFIEKAGINKYLLNDEKINSNGAVIDLCLIKSSDDEYYFVNFLHPLELARLSHSEKMGENVILPIRETIKDGLKNSNDSIRQKYEWLLAFFNERLGRSCFQNIKKYIIETESEN